MDNSFQILLQQIRKCRVCEPFLELGARPIVSLDPKSKVMIIGQTPGRIVHQTELAWNDKSGDQLRCWLGVSKETFYDPINFALIPMGFCYPGKGKNADLPPRKECAPLWHPSVFEVLNELELILLIGQYAQNYYLKSNVKSNLTQRVRNFNSFGPLFFPLPHPSPRNFRWKSKNPWFEQEVLPELQSRITQLKLNESNIKL